MKLYLEGQVELGQEKGKDAPDGGWYIHHSAWKDQTRAVGAGRVIEKAETHVK